MHGVNGTRRIPAESLYRDDGIDYTTKAADEIITAVELPAPEGRMTSAYWKLRRRPSFDFPILGVAAAITWEDAMLPQPPRPLPPPASHPIHITPLLAP